MIHKGSAYLLVCILSAALVAGLLMYSLKSVEIAVLIKVVLSIFAAFTWMFVFGLIVSRKR